MNKYLFGLKKILKKYINLKKSFNLDNLKNIKEKLFKKDIINSSLKKEKRIELLKKYNFDQFIKRSNFNKKFINNLKGFNFNDLKKINPENALLYFFFTISFVFSLLIFLVIARPLSNKNSEIYKEIKISKTKKKNIANLSSNLLKLKNLKVDKNKDTLFLIGLIGGSQNLDTFSASLNKIALENNVYINSYEPKAIKKSKQNNLKNNISNETKINAPNNELAKNQINENKDFMLVPELEKHIVEISVRADFLKILEFIRDIELLENIVLIDDFKIIRLEDISKKSQSEINFSTELSAYGRLKNIVTNSSEIEN